MNHQNPKKEGPSDTPTIIIIHVSHVPRIEQKYLAEPHVSGAESNQTDSSKQTLKEKGKLMLYQRILIFCSPSDATTSLRPKLHWKGIIMRMPWSRQFTAVQLNLGVWTEAQINTCSTFLFSTINLNHRDPHLTKDSKVDGELKQAG